MRFLNIHNMRWHTSGDSSENINHGNTTYQSSPSINKVVQEASTNNSYLELSGTSCRECSQTFPDCRDNNEHPDTDHELSLDPGLHAIPQLDGNDDLDLTLSSIRDINNTATSSTPGLMYNYSLNASRYKGYLLPHWVPGIGA